MDGAVGVHAAAIAQQQIEQLVMKLQHEGVLDEQFLQLMQLQDDSNPDFVAEVVQLYFEDSVGKIDKIGQLLAAPQPNMHDLDGLVHQFKGSSASLGAQMLAQLCIRLRECCQAQNIQGCSELHQQIVAAYALLRDRLGIFMQLETRRKQALAQQ